MTVDNQSQSVSRSPLKWLFRLILGIVLVWLLARGIENAPVRAALSRATPQVLVVAVALYLLGQAISVWRWRALLNAMVFLQSKALSFWEMARWYGAGMFWNLWMPTGIGGDAIRALRSGHRVGSLRVGAASVLLDRATGVVGLILVATMALIFDAARGSGGNTQRAAQIVLQVLAVVTVVGAIGFLIVGKSRLLPHKLGAKVEALRETLGEFTAPQHRKTLWLSLLSSFGVQLVQIGINGWLANAVGLQVSWSALAWLTPVLALSSLLPLGIGGLGVREAAAIGLLGNSHASGTVLAWSLLWQATVWLSSLAGLPWAWQKSK